MIEKQVIIENKLGLHLRPASRIVKEAGKYTSEISIVTDYIQVSAKSILGIMTLMAGQGTKLKIVADGEDEASAIESLAKLFVNKFDEE